MLVPDKAGRTIEQNSADIADKYVGRVAQHRNQPHGSSAIFGLRSLYYALFEEARVPPAVL